ncbi:MAG: CHAP domain-containing protein [Candidatus Thorarchaeota archaeon]|jgi:hypothetical protein
MDYKELQKQIIDTAKSYVGIKEIRGNLGWTSQAFEDKMLETGWKTGQAWCAYFTELVWSEVYDSVGLAKNLDRYFSGSARRTLLKFSEAEGWETGTVPVPGAVAIWKLVKGGKDKWQGHAGIVTKVLDSHMETVEGNTNSGGSREGDVVAEKTRKYKFTVQNGLALEGFLYPKGIKPPVPFKNKTEGDAFRYWVNTNHSEVAKRLDLDIKGSFFNSFITKAYNELGEKYSI